MTRVELTGVELTGAELTGAKPAAAAASAPLWTRLRFRVSLWLAARLLPSRVAHKPLQQVLEIAEPTSLRFAGLHHDYITARVLHATRRPWLMRDRRCLRQGLLGCRFLAEAGYAPELHFGIDGDSIGTQRLAAHCWVCINGKPVLNDRINHMTTILVHRVSTEASAQ
jgi:hypothetical protein